jgi:hypothetical protein
MEKTIINIGNIDKELWWEFRQEALKEKRAAGYLINDAMRCYLERKKQNGGKNESTN